MATASSSSWVVVEEDEEEPPTPTLEYWTQAFSEPTWTHPLGKSLMGALLFVTEEEEGVSTRYPPYGI
jgi:hypothetical protein